MASKDILKMYKLYGFKILKMNKEYSFSENSTNLIVLNKQLIAL